MDKESAYLLQRIDCNCNNCGHMVRDMEAFSRSLVFHEKMQRDLFDGEVRRMKEKAAWWRNEKGDIEKWNDILTMAEKMRFQFDKSTAMINYGRCAKFDKPVSFLPNTCQLDTQECFEHRRGVIKSA